MRFELSINCDGAAFDPDPTNEVAALLINACRVLREPRDLDSGIRLIDVNGNAVGWAAFRYGDDGADDELFPEHARRLGQAYEHLARAIQERGGEVK